MYISVKSPEHLEQLKNERKEFLAKRRKEAKMLKRLSNLKTPKIRAQDHELFYQKEYMWMCAQKHIAKKYGCTEIEDIYPSVVYFRDRGICSICKKYVILDDFSVNHKIAQSRGGQHTYENVQTAHSKCNSSKYNLTPEEYRDKIK